MKLTQKRLLSLVSYDKDSGHFTRIHNRTRTDLVGTKCGNVMLNGYIGIQIDGKLYLSHRLAFLYVLGRWPLNEVDHVNAVRSDNSWSNLRDATRTQNSQNTGKKRGLMLKGVELATDPRRRKRFAARICANGKRRSSGYFETEQEAHEAYCQAASSLHGEFARLS